MRKFIFLLFFFLSFKFFAQELNSQVIINSIQVAQTNQQVFTTLENALNEFINNQKWGETNFLPEEKINCTFIFNITSYKDDVFEGNLQVIAKRPAYNTSYLSPILNTIDANIKFKYQEFQPLIFNPYAFESNLVSLMSYYAYIILGLDAESFKRYSGNAYFDKAQQIVNLSQVSEFSGWKQNEGEDNRYWIINVLNSDTYREYKDALYVYHREGLDLLLENEINAKQNLGKSFRIFESLQNKRFGILVINLFFNAKTEEIVNILSDGDKRYIDSYIETLKKVAPSFTSEWRKIK